MSIRITIGNHTYGMSIGDDATQKSIYWLSFVKEWHNAKTMETEYATSRGYFVRKAYRR